MDILPPLPPDLNLDLAQFVSALNGTAVISIADLDGNILYANEMFSVISGYSLDKLKGKNHRVVNSGNHPKSFWYNFWTTIKSGRVWRGEIKNRKKNGETYWVYSIICPQFDENKQVYRYISFSFDITEMKKLEEALKEEKNVALHLGKLAEIGELAASVAHEINNPMAIISGKFSIFKRAVIAKIGEDHDFFKHADSIEKAIERIVKIVKNFREFSHKESDGLVLIEGIRTTELFEGTLSLVSERIKDMKIKLEVIEDPSEIYCDKGQIEQILVNLILNSIYEIKVKDGAWIKLQSKIIDDFVELSVMDSGYGIPPEIQEKLMTPFFTTKPVGQGTGLGLSICKKIAEDHGGSFSYDSKSQNTRFNLLLPRFKNSIIGALNAEKTITAHQNWKQKLLNEVKSDSKSLDPEKVSDFTACDLGKWITKSGKSLNSNPSFLKLKEAHKQFHLCASSIVFKIHGGEKSEIKSLLDDSDSEYNKLSAEVISLLRAISKVESSNL